MSGTKRFMQAADMAIAGMAIVITILAAQKAASSDNQWQWIAVVVVGLLAYSRIKIWRDRRNKGLY